MKMRVQSIVVLTAFLASIALLSACATTPGYQRAGKTTASMAKVESSIRETATQIDVTNAALNRVLESKDSPYVEQAYKDFADNAAKMEKTGDTFMKHSNQMTVQGHNYFEEWQQSGDVYTNPRIQQLSHERRNELINTFNEVSRAGEGARGHLNQYMSEIKQIRTYLSNDLSAAGIEAITPIAEQAINNGNGVKSEIQPMLAATSRARSEMSGAAAGGGQGW